MLAGGAAVAAVVGDTEPLGRRTRSSVRAADRIRDGEQVKVWFLAQHCFAPFELRRPAGWESLAGERDSRRRASDNLSHDASL
jgi:hypothetical protein